MSNCYSDWQIIVTSKHTSSLHGHGESQKKFLSHNFPSVFWIKNFEDIIDDNISITPFRNVVLETNSYFLFILLWKDSFYNFIQSRFSNLSLRKVNSKAIPQCHDFQICKLIVLKIQNFLNEDVPNILQWKYYVLTPLIIFFMSTASSEFSWACFLLAWAFFLIVPGLSGSSFSAIELIKSLNNKSEIVINLPVTLNGLEHPPKDSSFHSFSSSDYSWFTF